MGDQELGYSPVVLPELKTMQIFIFAILGVLVGLLSDVSSTQGKMYFLAKGILATGLFISIFSPVRFGIIIFLILSIVGTDISQSSLEMLEFGAISKASIWNLNVGFVRPSWIIAAVCLLHIIKVGRLQFDKNVTYAIVWFLSVPLIAGFFYGFINNSPVARTQTIVDIKFGIMLLISIVLFRSVLTKNPEYLAILVAVFMGSVFARHFIDLINFFLDRGSLFAGIVRVSVDSTKGTTVLLLLYSIYLVLVRKRFLLGTIIGIFSSLLLVVYTTRMLWVTCILGIMVLLLLFGFKRGLLMLPVVVIVLFAGIFVLQKLQPESAWVVSKKAESLTGIGRSGNFLQRIDPLRYGEIVNTLYVSFQRVSFIFGNGYGSYYTDDVIPFPQDLVSAFDEVSIMTGKFYRVHNFFPHTLFKHGLVGFVIITALWFVPGWRCYKILKYDPFLMNGIPACLIAFLITAIIQLFWSGKGLFINGFIIAVLYSFVEQHENFQMNVFEREHYGHFNIKE